MTDAELKDWAEGQGEFGRAVLQALIERDKYQADRRRFVQASAALMACDTPETRRGLIDAFEASMVPVPEVG